MRDLGQSDAVLSGGTTCFIQHNCSYARLNDDDHIQQKSVGLIMRRSSVGSPSLLSGTAWCMMYIYIYVYIYICICVYIYIYIHTCTHMYPYSLCIHTYMHARTHARCFERARRGCCFRRRRSRPGSVFIVQLCCYAQSTYKEFSY